MPDDQIEAIRSYLRKKLEEAQQWAAAGFQGTEFTTFRDIFRGVECTIAPSSFVEMNTDGKVRKQEKGVRFRVTWEDPPKAEAYIDVLIAPEWKGKPVVKIKVVDLSDGPKVPSKLDIAAPYVTLDDCQAGTNVASFFKSFLRRELGKPEREILKAAIFDHVYPTPTG